MMIPVCTSKYTWLVCASALAACADAAAAPTETARLALPLAQDQAFAGSGAGVDSGAGLAAAEAAPQLKKESTTRIGQWTGVAPNAITGLGMGGTDLGIPFRRGERLYFLFGDTLTPNWQSKWLDPDINLDSVAWTNVAWPAQGLPKLNWELRGDGRFLPLKPRDANNKDYYMREMSVPVEGVEIDNDNYIFFHVTPKGGTSPAELQRRVQNAVSVLARAPAGDFANLQFVHEASNSKFRSVSLIKEADTIWIYGSGPYRNSPVHLARATTSTLASRADWKYYAGLGAPEADSEAGAAALFDDEPCVGELSVRKHPARRLYFMTYNCGLQNDQLIRLRSARSPAGPWSAPITIFSSRESTFISKNNVPPRTSNDQPPEPNGSVNGAVYGAYMIPEWFSDPNPNEVQIVYTLSSWIPYQVHLMSTVLSELPATELPPQGD